MRTILESRGQSIFVQVVEIVDAIILRVQYGSDAPGWSPVLDVHFNLSEEALAITVANTLLRGPNDRLVGSLLRESAAAHQHLAQIRRVVNGPDGRDPR